MKIFILTMVTGMFLSTPVLAKDVPVECTFDGKVITGSCPADKAPLCDGKTKTIKCTEPTIKDDKK